MCEGVECYQAETTISHQGLQHTKVGLFPVQDSLFNPDRQFIPFSSHVASMRT